MVRRTYAGIDWVNYQIGCYAKILVAEFTLLEYGGVIDHGKERIQRYEQVAGDMMSWWPRYYNMHSSHGSPQGLVLIKRAARALPASEGNTSGKDENARFKVPDFMPAVDYVNKSLILGKPLDLIRIEEIAEEKLSRYVPEAPAAYMRYTFELPRMLYIGDAREHAKRNAGHGNSDLRLACVFRTTTYEAAHELQDHLIFIATIILGAERAARSKSRFLFPAGVNALEEMLKFIQNDPYTKKFMRNRDTYPVMWEDQE